MKQHHVVFYEPRFVADQPNVWALRGGSKYPSILGDLKRHAAITILMTTLPPPGDPHRLRLERDYGVAFVALDSPDVDVPTDAGPLVEDMARALSRLKPTIVSNLNGRTIVHCYASAVAAGSCGAEYVMRVAGYDLESRGSVITSRGTPFWGTAAYMENLVQERCAAALAGRIIVMTKKERRRLAAICDDSAKIHVSFRGVDRTRFHPAEARADSAVRFLFVGRKSHEKGYDILEAASGMVAEADGRLGISFAGSFPQKVEGNRNYVGYVDYDRLPELYRGHDALVVCSRSEGFPTVVIEAMSCGLPCILTRTLFEHDFTHEDDALLVDLDARAVADAMLRLARDRNLYARLATATRGLADAQFGEDANRERYHRILLGEALP